MIDTPLPPLSPEDDADALAAELALGLLQGDEAVAARARMGDDPAFAAMVRAWQERLARLAEELTPVMAPVRAKVMIDQALGHTAPLLTLPVSTGRSSGSTSGMWRWLTGGLAAAAVALALVWFAPGLIGTGPQSQAEYASDLVVQDGGPRITAEMDAETNSIQLSLASGAIPDGRDYELWWIEDEGATPISLGVVPRSGSLSRPMPPGVTPGPNTQLALSDEPPGGSPTGVATGPILVIAPLTSL